MARARQEGSSPEPVEGLARDGPRPFPLSRLVPSAVSCGLCEPGLPAAPAAPALLPAAYLCAPTAPPAVTAALGAPRWPGGPRSRPRGWWRVYASCLAALQPDPLARPTHLSGSSPSNFLSAPFPQRQEERQRHRPSPWRVLYNLIMGLLPFPGGRGAPEVEPN
nr:PREDICTED: bcl-2-binding component 3 [Bos indicus]